MFQVFRDLTPGSGRVSVLSFDPQLIPIFLWTHNHGDMDSRSACAVCADVVDLLQLPSSISTPGPLSSRRSNGNWSFANIVAISVWAPCPAEFVNLK